MANFAATINDDHTKGPFFGVLLFHSLTPGRFNWYILGTDDAPLIRGIVDCAGDPSDADIWIEDMKKEIATKLGVKAQQIKVLDSSLVDASLFPNE